MDSPILYHQNAYGQAQKCSCHQEVRLTFGNISLLISPGQAEGFSDHVHEALNAYRDLEDLDERCIYLATGNHAIMFALTYNELLQLGDILSHTLLMMQVEKALR